MKILISWLAYRNDYSQSSSQSNARFPDKSGPTFSFHENFWEEGAYEKHIILNASSAERDNRNFKNFISELKRGFPGRHIEAHDLLIEDVIDVFEIYGKLNTFLAKFTTEQLEAFISPGTPAMQTCWY